MLAFVGSVVLSNSKTKSVWSLDGSLRRFGRTFWPSCKDTVPVKKRIPSLAIRPRSEELLDTWNCAYKCPASHFTTLQHQLLQHTNSRPPESTCISSTILLWLEHVSRRELSPCPCKLSTHPLISRQLKQHALSSRPATRSQRITPTTPTTRQIIPTSGLSPRRLGQHASLRQRSQKSLDKP